METRRSTRRSVIRPTELLRQRLNDRQIGHSVVMTSLPKHLGQEARSKVDCLWRFDDDTGLLHVQAACAVHTDVLGELIHEADVPTAEPETHWQFDAVFNCQRTPPSDVPEELRSILKQTGRCYRSRKVVVPEADRATWTLNRLRRQGFEADPESLVIGAVTIADLGRRGGGIPYVRVVGTGKVVDADAWNNAVRNGIGSGRNFGLGLLHTSPVTKEQPA